jgi:hypothetical protein
VRTDPTDNGGLFVGRRPGTAPVRYRSLPERGTERRRHVDALLAHGLLVLMVLLNLLFWGPIPALSLWVAAHVQYLTGSVGFGILCGFALLLLLLFGGLAVMKRIDAAWIVVRRAAGVDQRGGAIGRVFAVTAVIGAAVFTIWFLLIHGPGSSLGPQHGQ